MTPDRAHGALLERLQRGAFDNFLRAHHPHNVLVADTSRDGGPCSIAAIGFAPGRR